ncbi:MAG TPA: hypothetical protein DEP77_03245, partial [Bacteroidales bacterium]|nr:hypothetical protein [Bacteroidales bacterium]
FFITWILLENFRRTGVFIFCGFAIVQKRNADSAPQQGWPRCRQKNYKQMFGKMFGKPKKRGCFEPLK